MKKLSDFLAESARILEAKKYPNDRRTSSHHELFRQLGYKKGQTFLHFGTRGIPGFPVIHKYHGDGSVEEADKKLGPHLEKLGYKKVPDFPWIRYKHPNGQQVDIDVKYKRGLPKGHPDPYDDKRHLIQHYSGNIGHEAARDLGINSAGFVTSIGRARGFKNLADRD